MQEILKVEVNTIQLNNIVVLLNDLKVHQCEYIKVQ